MSKPVATAEMVAEVRREIAMRDRVYPAWVKSGKLRQDVAQRRIDVMEAVALLLEKLDNKQSFLFSEDGDEELDDGSGCDNCDDSGARG